MKTLLIMRHGKSSWKHHELADYDRPLKKRGKYDVPKMGQLIRDLGLVPDLILSSSAKRAKQTAELFSDTCGFAGELQFHRSIYHGFLSDYHELIQTQGSGNSIVMIIGHNPGLEELVASLTDIDEWLPTSALAQISIDIHTWSEIDELTEGKLINIWRPRELI